ncbi:type I-E CRISPR-associated protein Cas5/CasD [Nocardia sp. 2YAB30]|uniref:type I-E CRISPR-associated protein Cas5/CasD n=1 Tax=unclassified Nocardia TaxID=2637762 RepID=UPI003F964667
MTGMILRLSGPLQSWGEHSAFTTRDTQRFPTRSGMIGIFATARGFRRHTPLTEFDSLRLTVRVDRPGVVITDFHTIGGGNEPSRTPLTAEGKRRAAGKGTIVTRRQYLSDAAFTVAVEGPDDTLARLAAALAAPQWQLYLGRRSCPPDQPLLLRTGVQDPVFDLTHRVPIHSRQRASVDLVEETASDTGHTTELADVPESFAPLDRRYRRRPVTITPISEIPPDLWQRNPHDYHRALFDYMGAS